jgi:3-oxoacyl-[acyl-carrier-protein] synthase II
MKLESVSPSHTPLQSPLQRSTNARRRVLLYGCGVIAPQASNTQEFLNNVAAQTHTLEPSPELGGAFLTGEPKFDFNNYSSWISSRHPPTKFSQLKEKGGANVQMAIGAVIDALQGNEQLEAQIKSLDPRILICIGSGFGDVESSFMAQKQYETACFYWYKFWAEPSRNKEHAAYCKNKTNNDKQMPEEPEKFEQNTPDRLSAEIKWNKHWTENSLFFQEYMKEFNTIELQVMGADVPAEKLNFIRQKAKQKKILQEKYACPTPPWEAVSANFLWNIPNAPAAQVSMLLGVHGAAYSSIGACSTFGLVVKHALDAIESGSADLAIVGTADLPPPGPVVAGFNAAKVLAAGNMAGVPLQHLRGTHVSGGSCVWIVAAEDAMKNVKSLGVEILASEISSDAEHIITPSAEGPKLAITNALKTANISPNDIHSWDMHATGTPGDFSELALMKDFVGEKTIVTARKGLFGHGMSSCGGWEATAQTLGLASTRNQKTFQIHGSGILETHKGLKTELKLNTNKSTEIYAPNGAICVKLNMGIGGITSCLVTKVL